MRSINAHFPKSMEAEDLVHAALVGFDCLERLTVPPLADEPQWTNYEQARLAMAPNLRYRRVADRYVVTTEAQL